MMKENVYDYVLIGAGPAGLQLSYYLEKSNKSYLTLESSNNSGHSFSVYPRHRKLISINKVHTGYDDREVNYRHDWNSLLCDNDDLLFKKYSQDYFPNADAYFQYLNDFAQHYQLNIQYNKQVTSISKDELFVIKTACGTEYHSRYIVVCTGVSKPYIPDIPGIELTENYESVSVDPEQFSGQNILILGKGNSGFETADNLIAHGVVIHVVSPTPLNMAWKTHFVGHLRAVNNNFLDSYQLKSQNALLDANIVGIEKVDDQYHVTLNYVQANEQEVLIYDRVICCTGFRFDDSIFEDGCKPTLAINNRFPELNNEWESTNIKGLYFCGTITQSLDYKKSTSGFVHGFRYSAKSLYHVLERKYHNNPNINDLGQITAQETTEFLIKRINKTSALWQQYGFLGDALTLPIDGQNAVFMEELTVGYIKEHTIKEHSDVLMLTLEYGPKQEDPFNAKRVSPDNLSHAYESSFLHPIIRYFKDGQFISEHHIIEDLAGEWHKEKEHVLPLLSFVTEIFDHLNKIDTKLSA